jgi:outer membrane lipase/esterase
LAIAPWIHGYFRYHTTGSAADDQALLNAISLGATGGWAGNGLMNTTILAGKFGLSAATIGGGGTNYANGGATTMPNNQPNFLTNVTTIQQIENYLASVNGIANPNALYVIKTGDNDVTYVMQQTAAWNAANPNFLSDGAIALVGEVARLQAAGARNIVVRNSYDSALLAGPGGDINPAYADFYARSKALWTSEWSSLTAAGVRFIPADNDSLFSFVAKNPTLFGFTASSVLFENAPSNVAALYSVVTPAQQQDYLFLNGPHFTTAGQTIEADYTYSLLIAPSQISLLAESAVQSGLSRTATIQRQVELSGQARGPQGLNAWAAAGYGYSKTETESYFPSDSGNPFQGTVGADYRTASGIILGGALTAGYQSQDFSHGGDFDQDEQTMSVYSAYQHGQFWGNAIAAYGLIQNDINRSVKLGIFTDQNNGDADGHSISLALRGGHDFKIGQFTTGPIVGAVFQEARIDGFTEHRTTGVTALSFNSQTRDSQVTQLGWRGSVEIGEWKPFVEATWNHEWNDDDRTVTTTLTSVSAPAYNMLATPVASDWGNATIGASYKINQKTMIWGSFSEVFGSSEMTNYGGELGLRISF